MDLGSPLLYFVCIVLFSAHRPARASDVDQTSCPCLKIPARPLTEPPPGTCFQKDSRFRYRCVDGYVRKAGTSDLIKCKEIDGFSQGNWSIPSLVCIPDPRRTTELPPVPDPTEKTTHIEEDKKLSTSITANPSDNSTANPLVLLEQSSGTAVWVTCAALAIICTAIGISFWCYKRRSKDNIPPHTPEELTHMNPIQSGPVI